MNFKISDATLVLACRDVKKGLDTKIEIIKELGFNSTKIYIKHLDLCNIASILNFCKDLNEEFSEIYALVNNAGVFYHPHGFTEDGFEITLQTNYLGRIINFVY